MTVRWWGVLGAVACGGVELDGATDQEFTTSCAGAADYTPGMSAMTDVGSHEVRLVDVTPEPPDVEENTWTIEVLDDQGTPVSGLSVRVRPWMPLHGHGISPRYYAGADQGDGTYTIDTFRLTMPGTWEFFVDVAGDDSEIATFALCAQG